MTQRGFLLAGPVLLYSAIAAGALIVGLSVALKVQSARLDAVKASLEACQTRYGEALEAIRRQNEAVKELEKASKQATERARQAQASAKAANQGLAKERERLATVSKTPPIGPCPAGQAVQELRKGLKP